MAVWAELLVFQDVAQGHNGPTAWDVQPFGIVNPYLAGFSLKKCTEWDASHKDVTLGMPQHCNVWKLLFLLPMFRTNPRHRQYFILQI